MPLAAKTPELRTQAKILGRAIAVARAAVGRSQLDVAEEFGVKVGTYRMWEQGRRLPPPERRAALARFWGLDMKALVSPGGDSCPCCDRPYPKTEKAPAGPVKRKKDR